VGAQVRESRPEHDVEVHTLAGIAYRDGVRRAAPNPGAPIGYLDCGLRYSLDVGSHSLFVGEVPRRRVRNRRRECSGASHGRHPDELRRLGPWTQRRHEGAGMVGPRARLPPLAGKRTARAPTLPSLPGSGIPVSGADTFVTRPAAWVTTAGSVTRRPSKALVDELVSCDVYGLDTEFHRSGPTFRISPCFQLAWEGGIALVDPLCDRCLASGKGVGRPGSRGCARCRAGPRSPRTGMRDRAEQAVRHAGRGRVPGSGVTLAGQARRAHPRASGCSRATS